MIYIFRLPGDLARAVCSICAAICGGACKCSSELCASLPEACACVTDGLIGVATLVGALIRSVNCFQGTLGCGLMLSCLVNGAVIWNAMRSLDSKLVRECTETNSVGTASWLIQKDLVLAIIHVVFVLYLKLKVGMKQDELKEEHPELGRAQLLRKSVVLLIQYDIAVCLYFFLWVYSFYENFVGAGLVAECENVVKDGEEWPMTAVKLLLAYAPLTVLYGCCLNTSLAFSSVKEGIGQGLGNRGKRRAQAREGTASYLPLAAGEPPQRTAAPQV